MKGSHKGPKSGKRTAPAMLSRRGVAPPEIKTLTWALAALTSSSVGASIPNRALSIVQQVLILLLLLRYQKKVFGSVLS